MLGVQQILTKIKWNNGYFLIVFCYRGFNSRFIKKTMKKASIDLIMKKEYLTMLKSYENITKQLSEKTSAIPPTRYEYIIVFHLGVLQDVKDVEDVNDLEQLNLLGHIIDEFILQLNEFKNALYEAAVVVNQYNAQRIKWDESFMGEMIGRQPTSKFIGCFGQCSRSVMD